MGQNKINIPENKLIEAIYSSNGTIDSVAKIFGVEWHTINRIINENENALLAMQDKKEILIDKAESNILSAIDEHDIQTSKWYLATIGKKRGYSEKTEIEHSGDMSVNINITGVKK